MALKSLNSNEIVTSILIPHGSTEHCFELGASGTTPPGEYYFSFIMTTKSTTFI